MIHPSSRMSSGLVRFDSMSARTRTEVGVLLRKAQDHLRKAQELHADLQTLMHRLAHEGIKNKRRVPRRKTPK